MQLGYYTRNNTKGQHFSDIPTGALVQIENCDDGYRIRWRSRRWYPCTEEAITTYFNYEPDEAGAIAKRLTALEAEGRDNDISASEQALLRLQQDTGDFHVLSNGSAEQRLEVAAKMQAQLTAYQTLLDNRRLEIQERMAEMQDLVALKENALQARLQKFQDQIKQMQAVLELLNLYCGGGQQITYVRDGQPALAGTPVKVYQAVRYANEECAILSDGKGLDFETFDEFAPWLLSDPTHINRFVPDVRGVCAMQLRRHADVRYTEDHFANIMLNQKNMQTFLVIRDGERICFVSMPINFGKRFFPTQGEFAEYYRGRNGEFLHPGSYEYRERMERATAREKYYQRNVLILQGLMDRTDLFGDLGVERPCVTNRKQSEKVLVYFHDGEKLLSDGRKSFHQWLSELQKQTQVGDRIMGYFGRLDREQIKHGYHRPDSLELYNVDKLDNGRVEFLFQPDKYEWQRTMPRRVRVTLDMGDDWVNFDRLSVSDIQFYLDDQLSRPDYLSLLPLLKRAMKLKEEELAEEKPFRDLLEYKMQQEGVIGDLDELIRWWKFKTSTHRALKKDDASAYTMIMAEAELRQRRRQEQERKVGKFEATVARILASHPETLYVQHLSGGIRVGLPENDQNVFVSWWTWRADATLEEAGRWKIVNRAQRDETPYLYVSDRFKEWETYNNANTLLSDPQLAEVVEWLHEQKRQFKRRDYDEYKADKFTRIWRILRDKREPLKFIMALVNPNAPKDSHWASPGAKQIERSGKPEMRGLELTVTKKNDKLEYRWYGNYYVSWSDENYEILWEDKEARQEFETAQEFFQARHEVAQMFSSRASAYRWPAERHLKAWYVEQERAKFLAEPGRSEVDWERKQRFEPVKVPDFHCTATDDAVEYLLRAGHEPYGIMTWTEMMQAAWLLGWRFAERENWHDAELDYPIDAFRGYVMRNGWEPEEVEEKVKEATLQMNESLNVQAVLIESGATKRYAQGEWL